MKRVIEKAKTVALTGHRIVSDDFNIDLLKTVILNLIKDDYDCFLIGMALGFDTVSFKLLEEIKREKNIKIIACVPCLDQSVNFNNAQKSEYKRMLSVADDCIILSEKYKKGCMRKRNEFMINNSSVLVAYVRRERSGAGQTERYAKEQGLKVINV